jgi:2-polyprenyl-3-methyl-5-hydroxy-6-metoxy-1,4-benzoquinol methylase
MADAKQINNVVSSLVSYLELPKYGIEWNEGERSIPEIWAIHPSRRFTQNALLSLYEFASQFTKDMDVLDFGCGVGYGAYHLAVRGAKSVYGIDLDEKSIQFGKDYYHHPKTTIASRRIESLVNDMRGKFDFVYCSNVMEHVSNYIEVFECIKDLLKPGGYYYHVTPPSGQARGNPFHITNFTIPQWKEILTPIFSEQKYFAHIPTRPREEIISEFEFDFKECSPADMGKLGSISGIILAKKS